MKRAYHKHPDTPCPKWEAALGKISHTWFKENLSESEFFARWSEQLNAARGITKAQRKIIYDSDPEAGRKENRDAYAKHATVRAADARLSRKFRRLDPVAVARENEYRRRKCRERMATDIQFRLRRKIRTRIMMALKGYKKSAGSIELLGCSLADARAHIESLFKPGMSWGNWTHDGWHLDHKRPCAAFDLSNPEQQRACFHYTNLQPLWWQDNLSKGSLIETQCELVNDTGKARTYRKR